MCYQSYRDVRGEMCRRQYWGIGDGFDRSRHQHALCTHTHEMSSITIFCYQHPTIVTNIKSPTFTCHQHLSGHFDRNIRKTPHFQKPSFILKIILPRTTTITIFISEFVFGTIDCYRTGICSFLIFLRNKFYFGWISEQTKIGVIAPKLFLFRVVPI